MTLALSILKSIWPYLTALILGSIVVGAIDHHGYVKGEQHIQQQWDKSNKDLKQKADSIQSELNRKSEENAKLQQDKENEIDQATASLRSTLDSERHTYSKRLLDSQSRAAIYRREAEAGAAQCLNLAGHTADLDASLEQGRDLVQQLRATLGQRDETVRSLGAILISDRKAVNSETKDGN